MSYIGKTPTAVPLSSSDLEDGIITTAKIADDAATADKIANAVNSAITANTSKTTNATHSGEVTGATALTIADNIVDEANLKVSNSPVNGYNLVARSGNTGGMTWEEAAGGGVTFKEGGTNFTNSLLVGTDGTGTLNAADGNTGVGTGVLAALTTGDNNVAIGLNALKSNTTGEDNTAIGTNALCTNTTGSENIAIGKNALFAATTSGDAANNNIAIGINALCTSTIGPRAIAIGTNALMNAVNVEDAVAIGFSAMCCNTARCSVAFGRNALKFNTSGMENTALGHIAAEKNTTGEANVAVGTCALFKNTADSFNTAIGALSTFCSTSGSCNTSMGWCSSATITTGDNNIAIGYLAGTDAVRNVTTGSNNIVLGNNNSATAHIKIDWTVTSDLRDKTEIKNVPYGLDFVNQITPIEYKFKKSREDNTPTGNKKYGFKAQEILALEGDNPIIINNEDTDNLKLTNAHLIPVLVNAIKELKAEIDELKRK
jgi:hypothetical protein